jgi:hypothetical protein
LLGRKARAMPATKMLDCWLGVYVYFRRLAASDLLQRQAEGVDWMMVRTRVRARPMHPAGAQHAKPACHDRGSRMLGAP